MNNNLPPMICYENIMNITLLIINQVDLLIETPICTRLSSRPVDKMLSHFRNGKITHGEPKITMTHI